MSTRGMKNGDGAEFLEAWWCRIDCLIACLAKSNKIRWKCKLGKCTKTLIYGVLINNYFNVLHISYLFTYRNIYLVLAFREDLRVIFQLHVALHYIIYLDYDKLWGFNVQFQLSWLWRKKRRSELNGTRPNHFVLNFFSQTRWSERNWRHEGRSKLTCENCWRSEIFNYHQYNIWYEVYEIFWVTNKLWLYLNGLWILPLQRVGGFVLLFCIQMLERHEFINVFVFIFTHTCLIYL